MTHDNFILTPITSILESAKNVLMLQPPIMENVTISDYILQSLFIKMTGFQEQKCKCINWELASDDYEYRYELLSGNGKYNIGEGSTWKDKKKVFKGILEQIEKEGINIQSVLNSGIITSNLNQTKNTIKDLFYKSPLLQNNAMEYSIYDNISKQITERCIQPDKIEQFNNQQVEIVPGQKLTIVDMYNDYVYRHRNRCAHNLLSYQENKPTMSTLSSLKTAMDNYFIRFLIIALIDDEMRLLYGVYQAHRQQILLQ